MKSLRGFFVILYACLFALPCFAQQPGVVIVNPSSKELKRAAHRLRIPVEQLKNARQTLQEATDLIKKIKPYPTDQLFSIAQSWTQLDRSKSKAVVESFIHDLRTEAASCSDFPCYQRTTSAAMMLMQSSDIDYEKMIQFARNWPEPKSSAGDSAKAYRESIETQATKQAVSRLASSDPEKALSLMTQTGGSGTYDYSASAQIAQGLMNAGKKDEALKLIDQTISSFDPNNADARALQDYEGFVRSMVTNVDSSRATTAVGGLVSALMNQNSSNSSNSCGATLTSGGTSIDLTCAEYRVLNIVRGSGIRPEFMMKTLGSVPGLKSKLDSIGGIDALYGSGGVSINYSSTTISSSGIIRTSGSGASTAAVNVTQLFQELKGKDPAYIKSKLRGVSIDTLINLTMTSAYQDPDLASQVLEVAQQLLPQVEPLQKRASNLQSLVQAYRQVDGEVDQKLLKDGFILADQLREEYSEKTGILGKSNPPNQAAVTPAGQLEAFLISELSRDSFDTAIRYVRSMENDASKLTCLTRIVQALSQQNF